GAFVLGQRPKDTQQAGPLRGGGVHLLGQGAKRHALCLEGGNNVQEMRQRAPEPVQFPDDETITSPDGGQCLLASGGRLPPPAGRICKQMSWSDAGGEQGVALQVCGPPVGVPGNPHVPHEHIRETPLVSLPSLRVIRHVFRTYYGGFCWGCQGPAGRCRASPVNRRGRRPRGGQTSGESPRVSWSWRGQ